MRQQTVAILAAIALVAWQSAWPRWAAPWGVAPDLGLALVVCVGMLRGPVPGSWAGLVVALLVSSLGAAADGRGGGAAIGGLLLSHIGAGYAAGVLRRSVLADRAVVAGLLALAAVPLAGLVEMAAVPPPAFSPWLLALLVQAPYTAALAVVVYAVLRPMLRDSRPIVLEGVG